MTDYNLNDYFEIGVPYYQTDPDKKYLGYIKFHKFTKKTCSFRYGYFGNSLGTPKLHIREYELKRIKSEFNPPNPVQFYCIDKQFYFKQTERINLMPSNWEELTYLRDNNGRNYLSYEVTFSSLPDYSVNGLSSNY